MKRNSTGHLTFFELYFAAQTERWLGIYLMDGTSYSGITYGLWMGIDDGQNSKLLYKGNEVEFVNTPGILSATQFKVFYLKIDNGSSRTIVPVWSSDTTRPTSLRSSLCIVLKQLLTYQPF